MRIAILLTIFSLVLVATAMEPEQQRNERRMGGYVDLDCEGEEPKIMIKKALEHINQISNSALPHSLHKCNRVQVQVVAGFNYKINIDVKRGETIENHEVVIFRNIKGVHKVTSHVSGTNKFV